MKGQRNLLPQYRTNVVQNIDANSSSAPAAADISPGWRPWGKIMAMKFFVSITIIFFCVEKCFSQGDTLIRQQQGILFLSAHNYMYDYDEAANEVKSLGFHDFFYPFDSRRLEEVVNPVKNLVLRSGRRVEYFYQRPFLKQKAVQVKCHDTSRCYRYDSFYALPVTIHYKEFLDYEPMLCGKNSYSLMIVPNQNAIKFEYTKKAIQVIKIEVLKLKARYEDAD